MADILILGYDEITTMAVPRNPVLVLGYQGETTYVKGTGRLTGIVDIEGQPIANAKVILYEERGSRYVTETRTDQFGKFEFTNLSTSLQFFIVAHGPSNEWEYLVSSKRTPVEP